MIIGSYLFQSPYTQPFQVGRPDPAMLEAKTQENREQQSQVDSNAQSFANEDAAYRQNTLVAKSATAYANSEGFAMSADQVRQLADTALKTNQSSYVKAYIQNR